MGIERADMAIRLVEERSRRGYSQADFARQMDISREGLRRYEMGQREIGTEFLARAAGFGIDVQYVLTGVRSRNVEAAEMAASPSLSISEHGSANVVQVAHPGSTINIHHNPKVVNRTVAKVAPGAEHITEGQAAILTRLVNDVVQLESLQRKSPKSHRAVWAALNAHCGVTSYRLISLDHFEKAETYLRKWLGRLNSMPSAPVKDNEAWRKRKYAYIKINTKDELNSSWLSTYLRKNFNVESIAELSDEDLDRTYRAVASRKRDAAHKAAA